MTVARNWATVRADVNRAIAAHLAALAPDADPAWWRPYTSRWAAMADLVANPVDGIPPPAYASKDDDDYEDEDASMHHIQALLMLKDDGGRCYARCCPCFTPDADKAMRTKPSDWLEVEEKV